MQTLLIRDIESIPYKQGVFCAREVTTVFLNLNNLQLNKFWEEKFWKIFAFLRETIIVVIKRKLHRCNKNSFNS